jgi:hypothetical protein
MQNESAVATDATVDRDAAVGWPSSTCHHYHRIVVEDWLSDTVSGRSGLRRDRAVTAISE